MSGKNIPSSLIDWDATKKYEAELNSGKLHNVQVETPEEKEEREKEEANSPQIAPGLHLPGTGGVFLFDQYQGKPELAEIVQNGSELNKNTGKSVLRATINPIASSKQPFELKGEHAKIQSHVPRPVIYLDIDEGPESATAIADRYRLVRATVKKDTRVVANLKVTFTGKVSEQNNAVAATVEKLGMGEWVKVTPAQEPRRGRICDRGNAWSAGDESLHVGLRRQSQCTGQPECGAVRRKQCASPDKISASILSES